MKLWKALAIGTFYFSATTAHADILFLNVNDSGREIDAAMKAAKARGEKLIVLPQPTDPVLFQKAKINLDEKMNIYRKCQDKGASDCSIERKNALAANREAKKYRTSISATSLKSELAKIKNSGTKLTSLVVSGHDGNGYFGGNNGELSERAIASAFAAQAPVGDGIRSMMLWGCYTANIGSLSSNWKKTLPNVELIAGYDGIAPLADKPANWQYLTDVLVKEKNLTAIKDANQLKKALNGLDGTNLLNASICVGDNFASHKLALNLRDAKNLCEGALAAVTPTYTCYLHAEPNCENPPANTGASELRTAYNKLQDARHCLELEENRPFEEVRRLPSPDTLIRLIHFKTVKANFMELNPDYLSSLNNLLKRVGAPEDLMWGDLEKMTRAEILNKLNKTNDYLSEKSSTPGPDYPEVSALVAGTRGLQRVLGDLLVPFAWVEPSADTNTPSMRVAGEKMSAKGIAKSREHYESGRASRDLNAKIESILQGQSKTYQAASAKKEEITKKLMSNDPNRTEQDVRVTFSDYSKATVEWRAIRAQELSKAKNQIQVAANELAKEPYENAEGKKAYNEALVNIVKRQTQPSEQVISGGFSVGDDDTGIIMGEGAMGDGIGMVPVQTNTPAPAPARPDR
ncbi:hypothetical protein DOM22_14875 [Bdellovibrio sp. ZAP7]|uniref:hypothetical protein n=1 Tax=Bdellovibrio sp. ZAP7 TaxID=2231053 RepID=UPI00115A10C7|nr:hypothetical protein [Bdellovibrio sp. ZAP7]QDK46358.1 hypothetical protein DOM22_14875 [Bdellovibrio sp. ZAP7]